MVRTRRQNSTSLGETGEREEKIHLKEENLGEKEAEHEDSSFSFQGAKYSSYEDMVKAKRKRNADYLKSTGLLEVSAKLKDDSYESESGKSKREATMRRGLKADRKRKLLKTEVVTRRKSSRLAGVQAEEIYVEDEKGRGRIVVGGTDGGVLAGIGTVGSRIEVVKEEAKYFNNRINDGSGISIIEAVENSGPKWVKEDTVDVAQEFISCLKTICGRKRNKLHSPRSTTASVVKDEKNTLVSQVQKLSLDEEDCVAKVVPDRIFSINFHPTPHKLLTAAGDKNGYVGLWDVNCKSDTIDRNGVHLFKPHNSAISNMDWDKSGTRLLSSSYEGSMRVFDIHKETFIENFATYDTSDEYKEKFGYGMDDDGWMQYGCFDPRNDSCIFYSTSTGYVVHIDTRQKRVTFNCALSEKKINTVSLHPEGHVLATCGLDYTVKTWDVRKLKASKTKPLAVQNVHRSINSAFFSPTGKHLLTTTMKDTLDIISDAHLLKGTIEPEHRIRHNNQTGRWLTTFHAKWHPTSAADLFISGSMLKPRTMQIYSGSEGELVRDISGEALTAVVSRCCFHPSEEKLVVAGGNSSGRVTVAR